MDTLGCAHFAEILQNFSEGQILWSLCLVAFHALTLRLPIQTSLFVVPELPVCARSGEKCEKISKTSTPLNVSISGSVSGTGINASLW